MMYALAVFLNRNETLKFYNELRRIGINSMVVSTPKGLGSSCSVSVKFYFKELTRAVYILKTGNYKTFSYFFKINQRKNGNTYEIINVWKLTCFYLKCLHTWFFVGEIKIMLALIRWFMC